MGLDMSWIVAMVIVIFAVVLMWTGRAYLKENGQWATDAGATQAKATLKSKRKGWRKSPMASQPVEQQYFATFELEDGSSLELYVLEEKKYFRLKNGSFVDIEGDIIAVNPGSLTYPRQENRKPSYIIMELDREGKVHFTINYL